YQKALDMDAFEYMRKLKRDGVTRKIGFSFHGGSALLERILTEQPGMDVVVLQINYVDWDSPSIEGQRCYELAVEHGLDIVVMEPLKGGALANLPEAAMAKLAEYEAAADATTVGNAALDSIAVCASPIGDSSSVDATSTDRAQPGGASPIGDKPSAPRWGLRFVQSLPGVTICLSGMNDMAQIEENMADVTPMSDGERDVLREVVNIINSDITVACTSCNYCKGHCPVHIPIAGYFNLYNEYMRLPDERWKMGHAFAQLTAGQIDGHAIGQASDCIRCGICVRHCPQGLDIPKYMAEIAETV
ncbi:MAG: aldo/keto reductase, partial [Eubacterium sp.]|nr:aldo/keto reductase [Candidatus Colimonas fimequi]